MEQECIFRIEFFRHVSRMSYFIQRRILDLFAGAVQILAGGVEGFEKIHAFTAARTARFLDG